MNINLKEQIVKNSFWGTIGSLINRIGGFIVIILISRSLKPEGFGVYSLAMTVSLFFITFSDFGINQTLIRYIASQIGNNNDKAAAYFRHLFKIRIFLTAIASLIFLLISYPLSFYVLKNQYLFFPFVLLSLYVFFISLQGFFESLFFLERQVKYISLKETIFQSARIFAVFFVLYFITSKFRIIGIFYSYVIISLLILFFTLYLSKKLYPFLFKKTIEKINKSKISKFIFFLNIENISLIILSHASIIFLGIFLSGEYVGYFNSSLVLPVSISSLLTFSYIFLPVLTKIKGAKFKIGLQKIFRFLITIAIPISFGLAFLSKFFIFLFYGNDYLPAAPILSILSFMIPCIIGADLCLISFSAKGKPKKFVKLMLLSTAIFLILNYIFIKIFSGSYESIIIGVALANLISWFFYFISSILLLKKEFNIKVIGLWIIKPIFSSLIMSTFIYILLKILGDINILKGIAIILFATSVYFTSLFLIKGIKIGEFEEILKIFFKFNKK